VRILIVHNAYGRFSGEEAVVSGVSRLLRDNGHDVSELTRTSEEIAKMRLGKVRAIFTGIHSPSSCRRMRQALREHRPDVVNVHNVYPLISPSVLKVCRQEGVPVVMTVHNYRLICPTGLFMTDGKVCHRCRGGREYWCLLRNCQGSIPKSLGYALRNWAARRRRSFLANVTMYAALTEFQRRILIDEGYPADRIVVVPNMAAGEGIAASDALGSYVGFVGRVSPEKGIETLREAARLLPDVPFKIAGDCDPSSGLTRGAPPNVEFLGHLGGKDLSEFYRQARLIVLPSVWYEGFPMILPEAMLHGRPVVASRIGGLPEIVEDGVTGLLSQPGDASDLAAKIRQLWDSPDACRRMGSAGRGKALSQYSPEKYYQLLTAAFARAIELGPGGKKIPG
jgi:glycosyltransferase involved in cell wall biosynthesis